MLAPLRGGREEHLLQADLIPLRYVAMEENAERGSPLPRAGHSARAVVPAKSDRLCAFGQSDFLSPAGALCLGGGSDDQVAPALMAPIGAHGPGTPCVEVVATPCRRTLLPGLELLDARVSQEVSFAGRSRRDEPCREKQARHQRINRCYSDHELDPPWTAELRSTALSLTVGLDAREQAPATRARRAVRHGRWPALPPPPPVGS